MASKPQPLRGNIFNRFLAAKLLGLPAIIMLFACLINIVALVVPFWFTVKSETPSQATQTGTSVIYDSMGLFIYLKQGRHSPYDQVGLKELNRVQKATNFKLVPGTLQVAQIMWLLGSMTGIAACAGLFIVALSPYLHLVGEIGLAASLTGGGVCLVVSILLSLVSLWVPCSTDNNWCNNMWRDTTVTLESVSWGFFIAIIGAVMMLGSAVMLWLQFCRTLRAVEYIRTTPYHPLDDEPEYRQYDYRKTVRPKMDYGPAPPMVTLPQMHDDQHGFPGVVLSGPPPPGYSMYDPDPATKSPGSYGGSMQEVSF